MKKLFRRREGWVGVIGLVIGIGMLVFAIWYLTDTLTKDDKYIRIEATVVEIATVRTHDSEHGGYKYLYAEVVEYTVDGKTYRKQNNSSSTHPKKVGSKMTVAYDPQNPKNCFFPSSNYTVSVLMFVLSAGFTAAGASCLSIEVKERKMEKSLAKIQNAQFITSAASKEQFIETEKPVIAICGKSNVGKSSFINMVTNRKKLAKVSKDPGRTRLVNYFDCGNFIIADLPGYGYASVSKQEKLKWARLMEEFFAEKRAQHVFALCDVRHGPTADDLQMTEYLYHNIIPFTIIATKADKLSKAAIGRQVQSIATAYKCGADDIIVTSSQTRQGLDKVLEKIELILSNI
ncbi:MAG: ribosome biogenesis GTP-binding protein YihA/YsxC [Clostridia bacterium]|nr:ribosome biogenesis GTP-binding protein YihA/YsxC [Clostridia bacterium]